MSETWLLLKHTGLTWNGRAWLPPDIARVTIAPTTNGQGRPLGAYHPCPEQEPSKACNSYTVAKLGAFVSCDTPARYIWLRGWPLPPPPFFRLACCSLHRCYRIVTDVGLSRSASTRRGVHLFSFGAARPRIPFAIVSHTRMGRRIAVRQSWESKKYSAQSGTT